MAKHLRLIIEKENIQGKDTKLKGVNSSKLKPMDIADLNYSPGNQKFAKDHTIEKHADRVGNGEEDYKGKTKQAPELRHGHIGKKSKEVYSKYNEETATDDEPRFKGKKLLTDKKKDLEERHLTDAEKKKKEKIVMSMKEKGKEWEERYPGEGKNIMYATATQIAKTHKKKIDEARSPEELKFRREKAKQYKSRGLTNPWARAEADLRKAKEQGWIKPKEKYNEMIRQKGIKSEPIKESVMKRFKNKMDKKRKESGPDTPIRMPSGAVQDKIDVGYLL